MESKGIGIEVADLYINWAFDFEVNRDFMKAKHTFERGLAMEAQPIDLLKIAHEEFVSRLKMPHGTSEKCQRDMQIRREQISSLRIFGLSTTNEKSSALNRFDKSILADFCVPKIASPIFITPVKRNITPLNTRPIADSVEKLRMRIKNMRIPVCNCYKDNGNSYTCTLCKIGYEKGIQLGTDFKSKNLPQTHSPGLSYINPPKANFNEKYQQIVPGYDKIMLIPCNNVAFSIEELNAYRWFKQRCIENAFTKRQDEFWGVGYDVPIRWANVFPRKNLTQSEWFVPRINPSKELNEIGPHLFMFNKDALYPKNSSEEYSVEEVMCMKRKPSVKTESRRRTFIIPNSNATIFNDQSVAESISGAIPKNRFGKTCPRNKPVPNRPKGLGETIFKQQMEIARAMNRVKNVKPKALHFSDENEEPDTMQHPNTPAEQREKQFQFWNNASAFAGIECDGTTSKAASDASPSVKLTTSVEEDMAAVQDIITVAWNVAGNKFNDSVAELKGEYVNKHPVDCSTPVKKPAHNYSFSYEWLETTAEFERLEALCAISPVKGELQTF